MEGDEDGYEEEYPLEGLELNTSDFMAKVAVSDFRRSWEEVKKRFVIIFILILN